MGAEAGVAALLLFGDGIGAFVADAQGGKAGQGSVARVVLFVVFCSLGNSRIGGQERAEHAAAAGHCLHGWAAVAAEKGWAIRCGRNILRAADHHHAVRSTGKFTGKVDPALNGIGQVAFLGIHAPGCARALAS